MKQKIDIKGLTLKELETTLSNENIPSYRAKQIFNWIYQKNIVGFSQMKNLPKGLITRLETIFDIEQLKCIKNIISQDTSERYLFQLHDQHLVESVLIRSKKRNTICLSSQVGCYWHCLFCASGKDGFKRNLRTGEIVGQILSVQRITGEKIHNIVFMGMGEPFDNENHLFKSIGIINTTEGINIGARKITISTCGIIPGIKKLTECPLQVELSVSLHAVEDEIRSAIMPVNKKYPMKDLINVCRQYVKKKNRQVTFEYLMLKDINDSIKHADKLSRMIFDFDAKVNLIIYNPIPSQPTLLSSDQKTISLFQQRLKKSRIPVTIRYSKGQDIQAACGQLRNSYVSQNARS